MIRFLPQPITRNKEEQNKFRLKTFLWLLFLFVLAAITNIPHSRAIKTLAFQAGEIDRDMNIPILEAIAWNAGTALILGTIFIWIGLWLSARANLGAPILSRMIANKSLSKRISRKVVVTSILTGIILSVILLMLIGIERAILPIGEPKFAHPSAFPALLASFSAGITEEIIFRLGLMSLFISGLVYLFKQKTPSNKIIWIGNISVGIIFGFIHIPMSSNYWELTPTIIATTIIGNLITGTTFGWIFWRYGLMMAMLAHFIFDVVFHVVGTPFN